MTEKEVDTLILTIKRSFMRDDTLKMEKKLRSILVNCYNSGFNTAIRIKQLDCVEEKKIAI